MKRILSLLILAVSLNVSAQVDLFPAQADGAKDVQITADRFEADQKTGWTTATGNVKMRSGDNMLTADKVRLNQGTGDVAAEGKVVLSRGSLGDWRGDKLEYNYKTGKGLSSAGAFNTGDFHFISESVTRKEDGTVVIKDAKITTCTNHMDHWHWSMSVDTVNLRENDYASLYGAVPRLFGVPFAYLPYWYRDLNAHYGLRLTPAYRSKWGASLLGAYVWNLYDQPRGDNYIDAKTHADLYYKRGMGVGQDLNWDLGGFGKGRIGTYWIYDQDPDYNRHEDGNWTSPVDRDRYIFTAQHEVDLSPRDQLWARGTYLSDTDVRREFMERDHRYESQSINHLAYEHREHSWLVGSTVSGPLNDYYGGVAKLPEGYANVMPQNLGWKFYYESTTRAGYYNRKPQEYEEAWDPRYRYRPGYWYNYDAARVDSQHFIKRPVTVTEGVTITPRAGWRGTAYDDAETAPDATSSHKTRSIFELGTEISAKAVADYTTIRHTFNPYLDYAFLTDPSGAKDGTLYSFDRVDQAYEWREMFGQDGVYAPHEYHGIRTGLRNIFQDLNKKERSPIFDWDVYGAYVFENGTDRWTHRNTNILRTDENYQTDDRDTGFRLLGTHAAWSPAKDFTTGGTFEYDPKNEKLAYGDIYGQYTLDRIRLGLGCLTRDGEIYDYYWRGNQQDAVVYGNLVHTLSDQWSWSVYSRGNCDRGELEEVGGYIQYKLDCLTFQLYGSYMPEFSRQDGTEFESDYRIGFTMWLNAMGDGPEESWKRW